jgi:hypothetical protein
MLKVVSVGLVTDRHDVPCSSFVASVSFKVNRARFIFKRPALQQTSIGRSLAESYLEIGQSESFRNNLIHNDFFYFFQGPLDL